MEKVKNILFVGVGGQGIILASKVLSYALVNAGFDVKMSEVHGMAQRGGSVTTQVRFGERVSAPIIGKGQADVMVAFEQMEAMRWIDIVKPSGTCIVNDYKIPSAPILVGQETYPEEIINSLKEKLSTITVQAAKKAEELGNIKAQNIVLLGALVEKMDLGNLKWEEAIKANVKEKFIDLNIKAFELGRLLVK